MSILNVAKGNYERPPKWYNGDQFGTRCLIPPLWRPLAQKSESVSKGARGNKINSSQENQHPTHAALAFDWKSTLERTYRRFSFCRRQWTDCHDPGCAKIQVFHKMSCQCQWWMSSNCKELYPSNCQKCDCGKKPLHCHFDFQRWLLANLNLTFFWFPLAPAVMFSSRQSTCDFGHTASPECCQPHEGRHTPPSWAHSPKTGTGSTGRPREASALTCQIFPLPVPSISANCKSLMWFKIWSHLPFSSKAAWTTPSRICFSCPISVLGKLWPICGVRTPSSPSSLSESSCMFLYDFDWFCTCSNNHNDHTLN